MRFNGRVWRVLALFAAFSLIVAACGDDDDGGDGGGGGGGDAAEGEGEDDAPQHESDGVLSIGTILPETGSLAALGPPEFAGAQLAVDEINAAGGVIDADVELALGDSGDDTTDIVNQTTDRHLAAGVDAIIGAASSGVSLLVIDKITSANVIQFSPANTSPAFTDYDDNGLYFRTAPSDVLQGRVLADLIVADGNSSVGIMAREDSYGEGLLEFTAGPLAEAGAEVTNDGGVVYDPDAQNFDAEVGEIVAADPDAFVMIGFDESIQILTSLFEAGYTQGDKDIYLVDGNLELDFADAFADSPGIMEGIRGTAPGVELSPEFQDRLLGVDPNLDGVFTYGAETYDAIIITALAAQVAGSDDTTAIAAEIPGVTRDGTACTAFAECKDLIDAGEDIDYDGPGGPYTFSDAGEPTEASFGIQAFDANNERDPNLTVFQFATLEE